MSTTRFGLLGPADAVLDGVALPVGGRQQKAVLAMLLLQAGAVVRADSLIWGLWGDDPPPSSASTLRSYVSRIRSVLTRSPIELSYRASGYLLEVDRDDVDVYRFEGLLRSGETALTAGNPAEAADLLRRGLALWRGTALEDFQDLPFATLEIARLSELRLRAIEARIEADLQLGDHRAIVGELAQLVALHPLREAFAAALATALYRADRQGEALQVLRTTRRLLKDELQVPPGPRLRSVEVAVLNHTLDGPARPTVPARPVRLPPRPVNLAGREDLLAEVHGRLGDGQRPSPRIVVLCGLGGVGKTSLAVEYAHRFGHEYDLVWQWDAEDPATLLAQLAQLARVLGAVGPHGAVDPLARLHTSLAARTGRWLLVVDNVTDPASVQAVIPPTGAGDVVLTSQYPHWPRAHKVEVPILDQDAAVSFLSARTHDGDLAAATVLAEELGCLPLALEQAGAFMEVTGRRLADYLRLFRAERAGLLRRGDPAGYDKRVATAWSLAFQRLQNDAPTAVTLLRLLACTAPAGVPIRRVLAAGMDIPRSMDGDIAKQLDELRNGAFTVDDALSALRQYSLIGLSDTGTVSIHRLVQAVTLDELPVERQQAWRQATAFLIAAALPGDPAEPDNWPIYAALLPHALAATLDPASPVHFELLRYLYDGGDYSTACAVATDLLQARRRALGAEHPDTLTIQHELAYIGGARTADAIAVRDQYADLLPIRTRVLGIHHPDTIKTRNHLAYWTGRAGDPVAARDECAAILPLQTDLLGPEHPDTLATRHNLAMWTGRAGNPAAARDQLAAQLPIRERIFGTEHPDTLNIRCDLAAWTAAAGDLAAARDQRAALRVIHERVLGLEHPDTVTNRVHLARAIGELGEPSAARDEHAALLPIALRLFGPDSGRTFEIREGLARWTGEAGDAISARDQIAAFLPVARRALGADHPGNLCGRHELAHWTGEAGDAIAARGQFAALCGDSEQVLGDEHPDTLLARFELAHWTGQAGDATAARELCAAVAQLQETVLGAQHPDTCRTRRELDRWTRAEE